MFFAPVKLPSSLKGQANGDVSASLLSVVDVNTYTRLMVKNVADAMRALHALALFAGIILTTTGRGRTLQQQWDIFGGYDARYEPCTYAEYLYAKMFKRAKMWPSAARVIVIARLGPQSHPIPDATYWRKIAFPRPNGRVYYRASSAVPGTSNHGWWVADDLAEIVNGQRISLRASTLAWLYTYAPLCGFAWETKVEPWHVHWFYGDEVPPALLRKKDEDMQRVRVDGDLAGFCVVGFEARWESNGYVWEAIAPATGPVVIFKNRAALKAYTLIGPAPSYDPNYTGGRTQASDFRT